MIFITLMLLATMYCTDFTSRVSASTCQTSSSSASLLQQVNAAFRNAFETRDVCTGPALKDCSFASKVSEPSCLADRATDSLTRIPPSCCASRAPKSCGTVLIGRPSSPTYSNREAWSRATCRPSFPSLTYTKPKWNHLGLRKCRKTTIRPVSCACF